MPLTGSGSRENSGSLMAVSMKSLDSFAHGSGVTLLRRAAGPPWSSSVRRRSGERVIEPILSPFSACSTAESKAVCDTKMSFDDEDCESL